ncbi:hypothetical protein ACF0H5_008799 [Mactra antiquata]
MNSSTVYLFNMGVILTFMAFLITKSYGSGYISQILVNNTLDKVRELDVNTHIRDYILEQDAYISTLSDLKNILTDEERLLGDDNNVINHPVIFLKLIRGRSTTYTTWLDYYKTIFPRLQNFNETPVVQLQAMLPAPNDVSKFALGLIITLEMYGFSVEDLNEGLIDSYKVNPMTFDELVSLCIHSKEEFITELDKEIYISGATTNTLLLITKAFNLALEKAISKNDRQSVDLLRKASFELMFAAYNSTDCGCSDEVFSMLQHYKSVLEAKYVIMIEETCKEVSHNKCGKPLRLVPAIRRQSQEYCKFSWMASRDRSSGYFYMHNSDDKRMLKNLKCYIKHDHPSLLYKGGKIEEVFNGDFSIIILHDVIIDSEIEYLKEVGLTSLTPSFVRVVRNVEESVYTFLRSSRSYILEDEELPRIKSLRLRLEGLTAFNVFNGSENTKIGHYGPTNFFDIHQDKGFVNDRLATIIIYLNNAVGGMTLFPGINLAVTPKKGSALVFPLIYKNGTVIPHLHHVSCPVILGEKWIATQWINSMGNEFSYPCSTNRNE